MERKHPVLLLLLLISELAANGCRKGGMMPYEPEQGIFQVTMDSQFEHYPTWSCTGSRIAYVCQQDENINIFWTIASGGNAYQLTNQSGYTRVPDWKCNDWIVYELDGDLWLTTSSGGSGIRIYNLGDACCLSCAPDGNRIAFEKQGEIYLLNRANGVVQYLIDGFQPSWSSNSNKIAFVAQYSGNLEIAVISLHDNSVKRMTFCHDYDVKPCWSPDGCKIAFTSNRSGNDDVWVVSAFGGSPVQVTNDSCYDGSAAWSPDGEKIAFMSRRSGSGGFIAYDTPPSPKYIVEPFYPDIALADSIEGTVILQLLILNDGMVGDTRILVSLDAREGSCDDAALAAGRLTRFYPAMQRNIPVPVWVSYPVRFEIGESDHHTYSDFSCLKIHDKGRLAGGDGDIWIVDAP